MKAAWGVEKKTFIDVVLKETQIHIVDGRERWVRDIFSNHPEVLAYAAEDVNIEVLRSKLNSDITAFRRCKMELESMKM